MGVVAGGVLERVEVFAFGDEAVEWFGAGGETFDEAAFLQAMERSVKAARGCPLEVTFRDIYSVNGQPRRLARAVQLTREAFARFA